MVGTSTSGGRPSTTSPPCSRRSRPTRGDAPTDLPGWDVHAVAAHTAPPRVAARRRRPRRRRDRRRPARARDDGPVHRAGRRGAARPDARRADQRDPQLHHGPAHAAAGRPAHRPDGARAGALRRHRLEHPHAAAQPTARRVDARAGRTPRARPARRDGQRRGTPHAPTTSRESLGYVLAKKRRRREPGTTVVLEVEGHAPVAATVTDEGRGQLLAEVPGAPDRAGCGPTGSRSSCWPVAVASPTPVASRSSATTTSAQQIARAPGGDPVTPRPRRLDPRRHPRPDRTHDARHRHDRRAGSATTPPSSWPAAAAGSCSPVAAPTSSTRPSAAILARGARRRARDAASSTWPTSTRCARRPRRPRELGPIDVLVNNAGIMATPYRRTARRPRAADGDQPLRPVPLHRPAAPAARRRAATRAWSRCPRSMHTAARAGARSATRKPERPLPPLAGLRPDQAGQPALHVRARPAAPGTPGCRSGPSLRTPASPAPTSSPTGSSAAPAAASRRILDAAVKAVVAVRARPVPGRSLMAATADLPGSTYVGPSGLGQMAGAPQIVTPRSLAQDADAPAPAVGDQRGDGRPA